MLFCSMLFLWTFLPVVVIMYYFSAPQYRNIWLLIVSLVFYAWGEPMYIILMLFSITINYLAGLLIGKFGKSRLILFLCIVINLLLLFYFKYFNLFVTTVNDLMHASTLQLRNIALPIGISFYTFQAMSYVIDLYKGEIEVQKSWFKLALYISFFPQLIAGPIVRYKDICNQIDNRRESAEKFAYGVKRFCVGLGKKIIISNALAVIVDSILDLEIWAIGTSLSWIVAVCYTLQIYYDFSGYSDMAIGLGKMFGFDIGENFNYPYVSQSIREFWRRWHISLSTWFREYIYIPLGGNRKGPVRTYINLFIVFFVTGLWHGAEYTFIIWGLWHGFFSIIERLFLGKWLEQNPIKPINYMYTMLVVVIGWIVFRIDDLSYALQIIKRLFVYHDNVGYSALYFVGAREMIIIVVALVMAIIPYYYKKYKMKKLIPQENVSVFEAVACFVILAYSIVLLICNTYNPFIYFRF